MCRGALAGVVVSGRAWPVGVLADRGTARVDAANFDLEELSIAELQKRLASGQDSCRSLVEKYMARIDAMDRRGPSVRQVLEINPDALAIADTLDAERKSKGPRGPLHGMPILIKDNIDTADRMTTTAGSLALEGSIAQKDAFLVARLRQAGAIILGKTNMSEWANFRSTHSTSGWSGRGGQALNPYALDRNPSGSSSGSGGATAASFCAAAIGTETDGSIVSPSSHSSLVGIKPTLGLVSRAGIIPIAHSQDTAGPMARSVADAAALLTAIVGVDPNDRASARAAGRTGIDYTTSLDPGGLKGARIGVVRDKLFGYSPGADALVNDAIAEMARQGAIIIDPANITTIEALNAGSPNTGEFEVLLYEFKAGLNKYLGALGSNARVHALKDVIAFNDAERAREMPFFGQEILVMAEKKGPLTTAAYRAALARNNRLSREMGIDAVIERHRLDALVAPTDAPPSLIDLVNGDHGSGGSSTLPAVAGYPHVTVPAGFVRGLPVGISFMGLAFSEPVLIRLAYAFEQATRHRRPPRFLPTVNLES